MMVRHTYKEAVMLIVNTRMGINEINLAIEVMAYVGPGEFKNELFDDAISDLATRHEITVVMYTIPPYRNNPERVMSWFLPRGARDIRVCE